jgi:hypothetical protein
LHLAAHKTALAWGSRPHPAIPAAKTTLLGRGTKVNARTSLTKEFFCIAYKMSCR